MKKDTILSKGVITRTSGKKKPTKYSDIIEMGPDESVVYREKLFQMIFGTKTIDEKDKRIFHYLKKQQAMIAGGICTALFAGSDDFGDIDIYFRDEERCSKFYGNTLFGSPEITTKRAKTYRYNLEKIQIICDLRYMGKPAEIISKFDLRVNQCVYDIESQTFYMHKKFLEDLAAKKLTINPNANRPISTMKRVVKYVQKGYSISGPELIKLGIAINRLEINSTLDLLEQIEGVSSAMLAAKRLKFLNDKYKEDIEGFANALSNIDREDSVENKLEDYIEDKIKDTRINIALPGILIRRNPEADHVPF